MTCIVQISHVLVTEPNAPPSRWTGQTVYIATLVRIGTQKMVFAVVDLVSRGGGAQRGLKIFIPPV